MDLNHAKQLFPSYYKSQELERILEVDEGFEFDVYRVCKNGEINKESFMPWIEEFSPIEIDKTDIDNTINCYSVSTFENFNEIKRTLKMLKRRHPKAKIAYGKTVRCCGLSAHTKSYIPQKKKTSHIDWWVFKNAEPHKYFNEMESDMNE